MLEFADEMVKVERAKRFCPPGPKEQQDLLRGRLMGPPAWEVIRHWFVEKPSGREVASLLGKLASSAPTDPARIDHEFPLNPANQTVDQRKKTGLFRASLKALRRGIEPSLAAGIRGVDLIEARLARSWELRFSDPAEMLRQAESAAVESLSFLDKKEAGGTRDWFTLRARAFGEYANALRVNHQFGVAQQVLGRAYACYRDGTKDERQLARLLDVQATMLAEQHQYDLAQALLDKQLKILCRGRNQEPAGRILLAKAKFCVDSGQTAKSLPLLQRSLEGIDPEKDPDLELAARFNQVWAMVQNGDYRNTAEKNTEMEEEFRKRGYSMSLLRARWLGAKIQFGLGAIKKASREFSEVHEGFLAAKLPVDAALVAIELARTR